MKMFLVLALLVAPVVADEVSPIEQVLNMITDLQAKVIKEGEESHKIFAEFSEWCEDQNRELGFSIKTAEQETEDLKATIEKQDAIIGEENVKLEDLGAELAKDESDLKAATTIRKKELADFLAEEKELTETIDTIKRALAILEREMAKTGGVALVQLKNANTLVEALTTMVQASLLSSSDAGKLTGLLQEMQQEQSSEDDEQDPGAPAAAVYKNQSGGIIATLQDLMDKAEKQLDGLRKAET